MSIANESLIVITNTTIATAINNDAIEIRFR